MTSIICKNCNAVVDDVASVTISLAEYEALKAKSKAMILGLSKYRSVSRSGIARKPELAEFILESAATMTVAQISDAVVAKFGLPSPSRSSIYRFIEKMKAR